jgi:hypothetical protein
VLCDESNHAEAGLSAGAIVILSAVMGTSDEEIMRRLTALRVEHRDLDDSITALLASPHLDQLQLARLKRRKLKLKDEIALLEDQLIPDIIA